MLWAVSLMASIKIALQPSLLFESSEGSSLALISDVSGRVQLKPSAYGLWDYVNKGQGLQEGNTLATGDDAKATVAFEDGRILHLGRNTQITIVGKSKKHEELVIDLAKGIVVGEQLADATPKSAKPVNLTIKSGKAEIQAARNSRFAIKQAIGSDAPLALAATAGSLKVNRGKVDLIQEAKLEASGLKKWTDLTTSIDDAPLMSPPDIRTISLTALSLTPPEPAKLDLEFKRAVPLTFPTLQASDDEVYWAIGKNNVPSTFPVRYRIKGSPETDQFLIVGTGPQKFRQKLASAASAYPLPIDVIKAHGRAVSPWEKVVKVSTANGNTANPESNDLRIAIMETHEAPLLIALDKIDLSKPPPENGWLKAKPLAPDSAPFILSLGDGSNFDNLPRILAASDAFSIRKRSSAVPGQALFFVKGRKIIASLQAKHSPNALANSQKGLVSATGADFGYWGKPNDLISNWDDILVADSQTGREVFVFDGNRLESVATDFIRRNIRARRYVFDKAKAIFRRSVRLELNED
jgi:hypothetical protein